MNAITVRRHWAYAMQHFGKRVENRTFSPPWGQRIAIHAGLRCGDTPTRKSTFNALHDLCDALVRAGYAADVRSTGKGVDPRMHVIDRVPGGKILGEWDVAPEEMPAGVIFASAIPVRYGTAPDLQVAGARRRMGDAWRLPDSIPWDLQDFVLLPRPIPCRGNQMLWEVPADIAIHVEAQVSQALHDLYARRFPREVPIGSGVDHG